MKVEINNIHKIARYELKTVLGIDNTLFEFVGTFFVFLCYLIMYVSYMFCLNDLE